MDYKVSVIVPVYNAAEYIERCVRSLMSQTLREIEYVFIDDCSTDGSMEVLERTLAEYPDRAGDVRIVRHETNKGVSRSRIDGLDNATGDYLIFCDSDDWVDVRMYEKMYRACVEGGADLCMCDYYFVKEEGLLRDGLGFEEGLSNEEIVKQCCFNHVFTTVWSLMASRELYDRSEARPPEGINFTEDFYMSVCLYSCARKIACVREPLYYYNMLNQSSIIHTLTEKHSMQEIECYSLCAARLRDLGVYEAFRKEMDWRMLKSCAWLIFHDRFEEFRKYFPRFQMCMLTVPHRFCYPKVRLMIILTAFHLDFICRWDNRRHGRS